MQPSFGNLTTLKILSSRPDFASVSTGPDCPAPPSESKREKENWVRNITEEALGSLVSGLVRIVGTTGLVQSVRPSDL